MPREERPYKEITEALGRTNRAVREKNRKIQGIELESSSPIYKGGLEPEEKKV